MMSAAIAGVRWEWKHVMTMSESRGKIEVRKLTYNFLIKGYIVEVPSELAMRQ